MMFKFGQNRETNQLLVSCSSCLADPSRDLERAGRSPSSVETRSRTANVCSDLE